MESASQDTKIVHSRQGILDRVLGFAFARPWMGLVLVIADGLALFSAGCLALFVWSFVRSDLIPVNYSVILPFLLVFVLAYAIAGLYPAVGISQVEEFRLLVITTTLVFLGLGTLTFYLRNVENFSRASFGLAWIFSIGLLPVVRHLLRKVCISLSLWGEPVVIIGFGENGARLLNVLNRNPEIGFRPTAIIDCFSSMVSPGISIPVLSLNGNVNPGQISSLSRVKTAILIQPEVPGELRDKIISGRWHEFSHLILIPDGQLGSSVWVETHDIGGTLGLEVRQKLFSHYEQTLKRALDVALVILASPLLVGLLTFLAVIIRLDSAGPVFYRQVRLGKGGKSFPIWKFRTMIQNADEILELYLKRHPELADEWNQTHKLKKDPRVTFVGKIMRRLSLDEFPQILNVLKGEMSLVGPRPIVESEISYYSSAYDLYTRVKPGLTGLWQVSGRNDTSYTQRVELDVYYVNNWSIWLDIVILAKTIGAVIRGRGAY